MSKKDRNTTSYGGSSGSTGSGSGTGGKTNNAGHHKNLQGREADGAHPETAITSDDSSRVIKGKTVKEQLDAIDLKINPATAPTFVAPTLTPSISVNRLHKIGNVISFTLKSTFDQGQILIDGVEKQKRAGTPVYHAFAAIGALGQKIDGYSDLGGGYFGVLNGSSANEVTQSVTGVTVIDGELTFYFQVEHAKGQQPLNARGENYSIALPQGLIPTSLTSKTIKGVLPLFATKTLYLSSEQTLADFITNEYEVEDIHGIYDYVKIIYADASIHFFLIPDVPPGSAVEGDFTEVGSVAPSEVYTLYDPAIDNEIELTLMSEIGVGKQAFDIRDTWIASRPLVAIRVLNDETGVWELPGGSNAASLSFWTESNTTHVVNAVSYDYKRYTYNAPDRAGVTIKLIF